MKKLIHIIALLFFAAQTQAGDFNSRLAKASSQNKTIVAKFEQTKKVVGIKAEVKSQGDFYYENSGRMAMLYSNPAGDKIIMNGEIFHIVTGGKTIKSDVNSNPMMAQISYMMQASMSGDVEKLGKGWELSVTEKDSVFVVSVKPTERSIKKYVSSMTMIFCNKTMTLDELRIDETSGGYTSYKFVSKQINKYIEPSKFQ